MFLDVKKEEDCLVNAYRSDTIYHQGKYKEKGKSTTNSFNNIGSSQVYLEPQIREGPRVEVTFETMVAGVFKTE